MGFKLDEGLKAIGVVPCGQLGSSKILEQPLIFMVKQHRPIE